MHDVANDIDDLCKTSFIVPIASMKCGVIAQGMRNSMEEFHTLMVEGKTETESFTGNILQYAERDYVRPHQLCDNATRYSQSTIIADQTHPMPV